MSAKAYRAGVSFVFVAQDGDMDEAGGALDEVVELLERQAFLVQGGSVELMADEDVVEGSPLHAWLFGLRDRQAAS